MEPQREEYKGHHIELRPHAVSQPRALRREHAAEKEQLELAIDNQPVKYARMADGSYALHEYLYDWSNNLMDLAKKYIDYREKAEKIRRDAGHQ